MDSNPKSARYGGIMLLVFGLFILGMNAFSYTLGERYWNYGPNDPFTTIIPIVRVAMWPLGLCSTVMGAMLIRQSRRQSI